MQTVHIYVETDITAPQSAERIAGYVLECITGSGRTVTKERFQKKNRYIPSGYPSDTGRSTGTDQ